MGPNRRHNNESLQMDSSHNAAGPKQENPKTTRLQPKLNERQRKLKINK